jgi:hypothetical protein
VTQESEEEMIKRRSQNADAAMGCLSGAFQAYDWLWILIGLALLIAYWLLG